MEPIKLGARSVINMDETSKRRPFFSTPEELYDEEYFDEQLPEKKRRLTAEQVYWLAEIFLYIFLYCTSKIKNHYAVL